LKNTQPYRKTTKSLVRNFANDILGHFDFVLERKSRVADFQSIQDFFPWFRFWSRLSHSEQKLLIPYLFQSKSQIGQDLFAILHKSVNGTLPLTCGYFVEFGATDGHSLSNTWLLEKCLSWNGILAEPCEHWHQMLTMNRTCHIDHRCVASTNGSIVNFVEPNGDSGYKELSSIQEYVSQDSHCVARTINGTRTYPVETVTLDTLLDTYKAPRVIDYLSIDTEGSELEIVKTLPTSKYVFKAITVEHNMNASKRHQIYATLAKMGYIRQPVDMTLFDDWYILGF
jgi:FkbM family methyltransferase